ncbi:hypothetical protein CYANOKiyG1_05220 [Okeania sp. KiyG1]|nr:hypothetical protein CYANOKiyG1_05220 [Okeania sp. KiyG1]
MWGDEEGVWGVWEPTLAPPLPGGECGECGQKLKNIYIHTLASRTTEMGNTGMDFEEKSTQKDLIFTFARGLI